MAATQQTHAPQRRTLHFDTIAQAIAEGERIAAMQRTGTARYAGNWTAGQMLNHCGAWAEYAYSGIPLRIPWFVRIFARTMRGTTLRGMHPGRRIPGVDGGTLAIEPVDVDQALPRFKTAFARLDIDCPPKRHPLFGPMTHAEWKRMHLNHAALHFSFVTN